MVACSGRLPGNFQNSFTLFQSPSPSRRMAVDPTLEVEEKVEVVDEDKEQPKTPEKKQEEVDGDESSGAVPPSPDPYYPPIIYLPEVVVNSGEEEEEEMFKRRAKLYRWSFTTTALNIVRLLNPLFRYCTTKYLFTIQVSYNTTVHVHLVQVSYCTVPV